MIIKITAPASNGSPLKLADAELHFPEGELGGLKLCGFVIWRAATGFLVTVPAREWTSQDGEPHVFPVLRAIDDGTGWERLRALILDAYQVYAKIDKLTDPR